MSLTATDEERSVGRIESNVETGNDSCLPGALGRSMEICFIPIRQSGSYNINKI